MLVQVRFYHLSILNFRVPMLNANWFLQVSQLALTPENALGQMWDVRPMYESTQNTGQF